MASIPKIRVSTDSLTGAMSNMKLEIIKDAPSANKWDTQTERDFPVGGTSLGHPPIVLPEPEMSVHGTPRWFNTLNYILSDTGEGSERGQLDGPSLWVDNLTSEEQEQMLLEELIYVLSGGEGSLIKIQAKEPRGISFTVDPRVESSLRDLTLQITQLGEYYYNVTYYTENFNDFKHGLVNQALTAYLRGILKEFLIMITQLEEVLAKGELTLQKMWFFIHPTMQIFGVLNSFVTVIVDKKLFDGQVLSVLHEKAVTMNADETISKLCFNLASKAAQPYLNILEAWIYKGMIVDPYSEFVIFEKELIDEQDRGDDYWDKRYDIEVTKCPSFLKKVTSEILKAGKYLNVIRECGRDIATVSESQIQYSLHERDYVTAVENAYSFASKTLLDLLLKEYDLMGRLQSVKHYLLMDQGDFIVQFLDLAEDELNKQMDDLNPVRLESLLELALRTSSSTADPYKDHVGVQLFPFGISDMLRNIISIGTPLEQIEREDNFNFSIPGVEAFAFSYNVEWPISLVLNSRAIACYQMIFRQLFFCKHVERQLCKVWIINKGHKKLDLRNDKTGKVANYSLCQKMLNFVQNLQYYMAFEVIDPAWHAFLEKMPKATNIDQVISFHFELLNPILADCMLTTKQSLLRMTTLLSICLQFAHKMLSGEDVRSHKHLATAGVSVEDLGKRFHRKLIEFLRDVTTLAHDTTEVTKVSNIIYRLNFNGYYTESLEKPSPEKSN